jgi:hypothetical protein
MDPLQAFLEANALVAPLFPPTSRYHAIRTAQLVRPDGTAIVFLRRRFVPPPSSFTLLQEHVVSAGDRLDNLAARYLGDPQQYWRIADANGAMRPDDLVDEAGRRLRITLPEGIPGVTDAS